LGKLLRALSKVSSIVNEAVGKLAAVLLLAAMAAILYGILSREILGQSAYWQIPLAIYATLAMSYLAAGYGQKHGVHVAVDSLVDKLGPRAKRYVKAAGLLASLAVFAYLSAVSFEHAAFVYKAGWRTYGLFSVPLWPAYLAIAVGLLLLCVQLLADSLELLAGQENRSGK